MKIHNEAAVEAQIQELRTITRLQGEPHWGLPLWPASRQLVILQPTQAPLGKSSRRACHVRGWGSFCQICAFTTILFQSWRD